MSSVPGSTAWERQGTLFRLPRELRDKIYRYVVKGNYLICRRQWYLSELRRISRKAEDDKGVGRYEPGGIEYNPGLALSYSGTIHRGSDLRVLCVSKTISDEAMTMLYSESTFRIDRINIYSSEDDVSWLSSKDAVGRMMNIELDIRLWPYVSRVDPPHLRKREQIWEATLRCISRATTIRKTLRIRIFLRTGENIPEWIPRHLEMLTRFRTIIVEASPQICPSSIRFISRLKGKDILGDWESMIEAITRHLGHAWGPVIVHRSDQHDPTQPDPRTLIFHPQEHMAAVLRARAEILRAEAETLELEAGMQLVGI